MGNATKAIIDSGGSRKLLDKLQEMERQESNLIFQLSRLDDAPEPILDLDIDDLGDHIIRALETDKEGINNLLRNLIHRIEVKRKKMTIRGTIYYYSPAGGYGSEHIGEKTHSHKLKVKL